MVDVVRRTAQRVFVPLTVGGGISSVDDFRELLRSGADKVSVNSAAVRNPQLIHDAAEIFGSQCVVVAIDAKKKGDSWTVVVNGGRIDMNIDAIEWAKKAEELGAGEILLTSMDTDGMKTGFDIELLNAVCDVVKIPVIASGGCGTLEHFSEVFQKTKASAALAASLFHYKELTVSQVMEHLEENKKKKKKKIYLSAVWIKSNSGMLITSRFFCLLLLFTAIGIIIRLLLSKEKSDGS